MDIDAERAAFDETARRFTEIADQALANRKDREISLFRKIIASVSSLAGKPKVSMHDAWDGLSATLTILRALVSKATTYEELNRWNAAMLAATDELRDLVAKDWESRTKAYAPLTQAFRDSAEALKLAKSKADQMANQLNLAADVLGAFTKLLSAFA